MKTLVHTLDILGLQTFAKEANTLASHVEVCVCLCVSVSLCLCLSLSLSLSLCIQLWLLFFSPSGRVTLRRVLFFFSYPQLFCQFFFTFSPSLQDATQGHACCFEYFLFIIYLFIYLFIYFSPFRTRRRVTRAVSNILSLAFLKYLSALK